MKARLSVNSLCALLVIGRGFFFKQSALFGASIVLCLVPPALVFLESQLHRRWRMGRKNSYFYHSHNSECVHIFAFHTHPKVRNNFSFRFCFSHSPSLFPPIPPFVKKEQEVCLAQIHTHIHVRTLSACPSLAFVPGHS